MVLWIVRLEGFVFFLFSILFYYFNQGNWFLFAILFLAPDLSMIGYLKNKKVGAIVYNLFHNYIIAFSMFLLGIFIQYDTVTQIGAILIGHVGLDRLFGYGLKYPTGFKDTHLQKL